MKRLVIIATVMLTLYKVYKHILRIIRDRDETRKRIIKQNLAIRRDALDKFREEYDKWSHQELKRFI